MRVAISLLTYLPGRVGGSEVYVQELVKALAHRGVDLEAWVNASAATSFPGSRTTVVAGGGAGGWAKLLRLARVTLRPRRLREAIGDVDVVHYPLTVATPSVDRPWVTTLHDIQHRDLPELFTRAARRYRAVTYDRAARRAEIVVVPSEFVRERAVDLLGLDPERVVTIHHGVDHDRFGPGTDAREPFLLYPARPWPHKNHRRLFEALALLRRVDPDLRLVLTGAGTEALAGHPGVEARGSVHPDELASLYRRAACLVFPSLYEGFGLPPLEAMACGTPVAAARAGSLPEVCDDAAVLFAPDDAESIADAVTDALRRAPELDARGRRRAAAFTWERTAAAHENVYRTAARLPVP